MTYTHHMRMIGTARGQGGFTLIEAVIAIILTVIISVGVAIFIRLPVSGYVDSAARADLADTADTALRRMARDLRLSLPNSVRVGTDGSGAYYIEELLTRTGGRYLDSQDAATSGNILDLSGASLKFDIVGPIPGGEQTIQAGSDSVVINSQGPGIQYGDPYVTSGSTMNRALISSLSGPTITMANNPFSPTQSLSSHRFQVISGPVTYRCDPTAGTVTRYWNYTITASQPLSVAALSTGASAQNALIANGVSSNNGCVFSYASGATMAAGGLAILKIKLASTDSGGSTVELFQQVHIDNTP